MHALNMAASVYKVVWLTSLCAGLALSAEHMKYEQKSTWLPRASARPLNVDPKLDCAIKELAWEYAKKLLPQVSHIYHRQVLCDRI